MPSKAERASTSEHVGKDVQRNAVADENDDEDEDHWRNINAAEIRHHAPDRPQDRLGDAVEEIADRAHDRVADIHHVEGDQPGENRRRDQYPDVYFEG